MVADKRSQGFIALRAAISLPLVPLQAAISWPTKAIDQMKDFFSSHNQLIAENTQLKSQQLLLRTELQRFTAIETENTYLKALLQSAQQVKGRTLIAELLAVDTEPFVKQVTLDKGTKDGVYNGQPVLDANGVMGHVIQAGLVSSKVLLINDPHSGISLQNARNGLRAVAYGNSYSDKLQLMYIAKTMDIQVGDMFITSGLGDHYPEGYPVGKVLTVNKDPAHQFATVILQPSARLDSSRQVLLVWYKDNA